jgi:hypothetical protein
MYVIRFQAALFGRCNVRRGVRIIYMIIYILRLYLAAESNERALLYMGRRLRPIYIAGDFYL